MNVQGSAESVFEAELKKLQEQEEERVFLKSGDAELRPSDTYIDASLGPSSSPNDIINEARQRADAVFQAEADRVADEASREQFQADQLAAMEAANQTDRFAWTPDTANIQTDFAETSAKPEPGLSESFGNAVDADSGRER